VLEMTVLVELEGSFVEINELVELGKNVLEVGLVVEPEVLVSESCIGVLEDTIETVAGLE
jgi:hypothetical protein